MPRPTSKSFDASWAALIRTTMVQGTQGRPSGEGWKSVDEFAKETGLSLSHASHSLVAKERAGLLEKQRAKIGNCWRNFYRPVQ